MAEGDGRLFGQLIDAVNPGDLEAALAYIDPEFELRAGGAVQSPSPRDGEMGLCVCLCLYTDRQQALCDLGVTESELEPIAS